MLWSRKVKVERVALERGRLYRVREDGAVLDLGATSEEDLKLIAAVSLAAAVRGGHTRLRVSPETLGKVRGITRRLYDLAVK